VRIIVCRDAEAASAAVARRIAAAVRRKPSLVLGLPTGQTPVRLYARLAARVAAGELDFSRVRTFNLDEFLGVSKGQPGSYRAFMERHVFGPLRVPRERTHVLDGRARDVAAECERFEAAIGAAGGIDLQLVGLGLNGHIGFNEPGPQLIANTHRVKLAPPSRRANAELFGGDVRRVPREALSMGMGTILRARRLVMLATGASKARVVRRLVEGPVTTWLPASFLQLHADAEVVLDESAAGRLAALRD
jgi:glucosamine-6-phosphate deaminase